MKTHQARNLPTEESKAGERVQHRLELSNAMLESQAGVTLGSYA
jgi:hypothetical protein